MVDDDTLVNELLEMAKRPDGFSQFELGEMLLVAATEIIKLRGLHGSLRAISQQNDSQGVLPR